MKNLTGESMNITEENLKSMQQLFPEAFEEGKIDFDVLRQLLGDFVDDEQERYSFKWNGKDKALRLSTKRHPWVHCVLARKKARTGTIRKISISKEIIWKY